MQARRLAETMARSRPTHCHDRPSFGVCACGPSDPPRSHALMQCIRFPNSHRQLRSEPLARDTICVRRSRTIIATTLGRPLALALTVSSHTARTTLANDTRERHSGHALVECTKYPVGRTLQCIRRDPKRRQERKAGPSFSLSVGCCVSPRTSWVGGFSAGLGFSFGPQSFKKWTRLGSSHFTIGSMPQTTRMDAHCPYRTIGMHVARVVCTWVRGSHGGAFFGPTCAQPFDYSIVSDPALEPSDRALADQDGCPGRRGGECADVRRSLRQR